MSLTTDIEALVQPWVSTPDEARALAVAISQLVPQTDAASTGVHDGNHALLVGRILGILIKSDANDPSPNFHALDAHPVMFGTDYTNRIMVTQPSGHYLITIEPVDVEQR